VGQTWFPKLLDKTGHHAKRCFCDKWKKKKTAREKHEKISFKKKSSEKSVDYSPGGRGRRETIQQRWTPEGKGKGRQLSKQRSLSLLRKKKDQDLRIGL